MTQFLLKRVRLVDEDVSNWQSDLFTWSQLRHEHILRYHDAWVARDMQHVLCETARFCLPVLLERMAPDKPCQSLFPVWLFHIASALEYMHERNNENRPILHRNLRPSSILVTDHCTLKLCDFAFSK
nr:hypothetical protein BaRGS_020077 [Batillaria attramentaria]